MTIKDDYRPRPLAPLWLVLATPLYGSAMLLNVGYCWSGHDYLQHMADAVCVGIGALALIVCGALLQHNVQHRRRKMDASDLGLKRDGTLQFPYPGEPS